MKEADALWEHIPPKDVRPGDVIMCYAHDDQLEQANCRVVSVRLEGPGVYTWRTNIPNIQPTPYEYRVHLVCRHISLRRLDAEGGPEFNWHFFNWNSMARFRL